MKRTAIDCECVWSSDRAGCLKTAFSETRPDNMFGLTSSVAYFQTSVAHFQMTTIQFFSGPRFGISPLPQPLFLSAYFPPGFAQSFRPLCLETAHLQVRTAMSCRNLQVLAPCNTHPFAALVCNQLK